MSPVERGLGVDQIPFFVAPVQLERAIVLANVAALETRGDATRARINGPWPLGQIVVIVRTFVLASGVVEFTIQTPLEQLQYYCHLRNISR